MKSSELEKLLELFELKEFILLKGISNKVFKVIDIIDNYRKTTHWNKEQYIIVVQEVTSKEIKRVQFKDIEKLHPMSEQAMETVYVKKGRPS